MAEHPPPTPQWQAEADRRDRELKALPLPERSREVVKLWRSEPDPARIAEHLPRLIVAVKHFLHLAESPGPDRSAGLPQAARKIAGALIDIDFSPAWATRQDVFELGNALWCLDLAFSQVVVRRWGGQREPIWMPDFSIRLGFIVPARPAGKGRAEDARAIRRALAMVEDAKGPAAELSQVGGEGPAAELSQVGAEARDRYCYERVRAGELLGTIRAWVNVQPRWPRLQTNEGVRRAADAYARRAKLPPLPRRKQGRRKSN